MEKVTCFGTDKVNKDTWDYCSNNLSFDEKDLYGISWPPRHYTCSFCRRKFKSAQALGGHMNVHRRDRAMLRQPPSWVVQYPTPNPNPNPTPNLEFKYSSSSSSSLSPPSAPLPPPPYSSNFKLKSLMMMSPSLTSQLSSASSASTIYDERKVMVMGPPPRKPFSPRRREKTKQSMRALSSTVELEGLAQEDEYNKVMMNNNGQIARLDLEIGLVRNNKKEDLDLELRLGYS